MKINNRILYIAWAVLYVLGAAVSVFCSPTGAWFVPALILTVLFFVPPSLLLWGAVRNKQGFPLRLVRNLCIGSLASTTLILCLIFVSVGLRAGTEIGVVLQVLLERVSVPMMCSPVWAVDLFFWACLLMVCIQYRKIAAPEKKKQQKNSGKKTTPKKKRK